MVILYSMYLHRETPVTCLNSSCGRMLLKYTSEMVVSAMAVSLFAWLRL